MPGETHRIVALIIGEDEQDIWFLSILLGPKEVTRGEQAKSEK